MLKSSILPYILVGSLLGMTSAYSQADSFHYRVPNKSLRAGVALPDSGTVTVPVGSGAGTGGNAGSGTNPGSGTTPDSTTTPPAGTQPTYATSGVQFLLNGRAISELYMGPGDAVTLVIKNTSSSELRGWLGSSQGETAYADLNGSSCTQNAQANVPTVLAPGAQCNFTLATQGYRYGLNQDYFSFVSLKGENIPSTLTLLANYNTQPGGPMPTGPAD